ncbi:hypothetical protein AB0J86_37615 [Micromonospora sp. NPDC049559]|uniref:hypothetical protein n=1 Tax=Micromonospora sp. NPDC049559 TaxID=3155923 RepID=UPI00341E29BC
MAHGEAEQGRAEGEKPCLLGNQEQQPATAGSGKLLRWSCGATPPLIDGAAAAPADRSETDDPAARVPRQRVGEPAGEPEAVAAGPTCRPDRPGWAGAHRHGAVRPRPRATRRERPPDRWC